jgi:plastocyanin
MHMKRLLVAAICAVALALAACGSPGGGRHPAEPGRHRGAATITMQNYGYTGDLTVTPGADVTVVNKDSTAHTLTDKATGRFDTGVIAGGGSRSFVAPAKPGRYPFGCTLHPEMSGVLTVAG